MCAYKTWFHNDTIGYITECLDCQHIQLAFGNVLITLEQGDFEVFRKYIQRSNSRYQHSPNPQARSIVLRTPSRGISFLLSEAELHGLNAMIDYADTEMKAASLIKLFNT